MRRCLPRRLCFLVLEAWRQKAVRNLPSIFCLLALSGCALDPRDLGREPHMSPIGAGLHHQQPQLPATSRHTSEQSPGMIIDENRINLYRDLRAMSVGDVVTVNISIDDKAIIGNTTDRSRNSEVKSVWSFLFDFIPGTGSSPAPSEHSGQERSTMISSPVPQPMAKDPLIARNRLNYQLRR